MYHLKLTICEDFEYVLKLELSKEINTFTFALNIS